MVTKVVAVSPRKKMYMVDMKYAAMRNQKKTPAGYQICSHKVAAATRFVLGRLLLYEFQPEKKYDPPPCLSQKKYDPPHAGPKKSPTPPYEPTPPPLS